MSLLRLGRRVPLASLMFAALLLSSSCIQPSSAPPMGLRIETYTGPRGGARVPEPFVPVLGFVNEDFGPGNGNVDAFMDETDFDGVHNEPDAKTNAEWQLQAGPKGPCAPGFALVIVPINELEIVRFTCFL